MPDYEAVADALLAHPWTFAKTMPGNPHFWTHAKTWRSESPSFQDVLGFIRTRGYPLRFGRSTYSCLDVNEHRYWTMVADFLINRAVNHRDEPYDAIAPVYDALHASPDARAEEMEIIARLGYAGGAVLDIGCGTGLLLDHLAPDDYLGVDPSREMLARLAEKHPGAAVLCTRFESFYLPRRFALAVGLFGAPSYVPDHGLLRLQRMLEPGGRFLLMFYAPDYTPVTYQRSGVEVPHFDRKPEQIAELLGVGVSRQGGYLVAEGWRAA